MPYGAVSYTYSSGSPVVSPTANASYYISGSDINGCLSDTVAVCNVAVNPLPTLTLTTSDSLICSGQSVTLTVNGASSYTWNTNANSASIVVTPTNTLVYSITGTDGYGCNSQLVSITQNVSPCTGLKNGVVTESEPTVFPNPAFDVITIVCDLGVFEIYNSLGQLIDQGKVIIQKQISVNQYTQGVYHLRIKTKNGLFSRKMIKE
jgi:hypothetical protein